MSNGGFSLKVLYLLGMTQLFVFLGSCSGDNADRFITVTPSVTEGFAPLNVTFDFVESNTTVKNVIWDFGDGEILESDGISSVSHTFFKFGIFDVSVSVDTTTSTSPVVFILPITVFQDINLIVSSFAIDTEVTPGSLETVSAIIQNVGTHTFTAQGVTAAVPHIDVGYYLSADDNITVDDIFIGDTSVFVGDFFTGSDIPFGFQSLAPGENYQYDHQLAVKGNIPAGTYYAGAIVDYIDEFDWYTFPRSTDTLEFGFPSHVVVVESNEEDNVRLLPAYQVTVSANVCVDDPFEDDDSSATATLITLGETQDRNFCFDNSDWLQFDAVQGDVYKITTFSLGAETDTQLILYDTDGSSILLFHDNMGNTEDETHTVDLESGFPPNAASEIVWETQVTGTYFVKVRTTTCDEDLDDYCLGSPDGVGLNTGYSIILQ